MHEGAAAAAGEQHQQGPLRARPPLRLEQARVSRDGGVPEGRRLAPEQRLPHRRPGPEDLHQRLVAGARDAEVELPELVGREIPGQCLDDIAQLPRVAGPADQLEVEGDLVPARRRVVGRRPVVLLLAGRIR
jgi:hypothetical protein